MLFNLLNFGSGTQAVHYFVFCLVAIIGTLQGVAARYGRRELVWLDGRPGLLLGGVIVAASFIWFFVTDEEIFIPGLAGGELFAVFIAAFFVAVPITRLISALILRTRSLAIPSARDGREEEPLV